MPLAEPSGAISLVEFQPLLGDGSPSYASTDDAGRYEMMFSQQRAGAMVCEHTVRISTFNENEKINERVPPEYHRNSQITRNVVAGETNTFDFSIETKTN